MKEKAPADPSPTRGINQTKTRRTTFFASCGVKPLS